MDPKGGQPMADEKGRMPWIVAVALIVVALGIAAVTLRHKVTVIDGTMLLLERWTGRVTLIHKDGRITKVEKGNPVKGPGFRLSKLFKGGGETGAKTVKGSGGKAARGSGSLNQPAKAAKKALDADQAAVRVSPFASGATTSKELAQTGAKIYSSIKWQGEQAHFQVAIRPYTDELKKLRRDKEEAVRIDLVDGKGAAVLNLTIPLDDMKPVRDDKNKITALEYAKNIPIGRTDFQSIQDWKIRRKV
jgi:hypothetical protein